MNGQFALLTAPGTAAIATFSLWGKEAWEVLRSHFRTPKGNPLPEEPSQGRTWFGRLGDDVRDEVILVATHAEPIPAFEVHCHGGPMVQRMLIDLFDGAGLTRTDPAVWLGQVGYGNPPGGKVRDASESSEMRSGATRISEDSDASRTWMMRPHAATRRTAGILVDQLAIREIGPAASAFAEIGRHLIDPWKVAIAGPPNVGKSSLVNVLAGYQRSIVAPIPGTTRDAVSVPIALDGWPIELTDTAGLRETSDSIEGEGIRRARTAVAECDLLLWMTDAESWPNRAEPEELPASNRVLKIVNKIDLAAGDWADWWPISTVTGQGIGELIAAIVRELVPVAPPPGAAVPLPPV